MTNNHLNQFETYRPLMFSIAYRMLGSATDAEDIVQEAYLRYQSTSADEIVSPKAFLTTIVTRLCLNQLQSAQQQRETYIGPWLPEPVLTDTHDEFAPANQAELHDSLSIAFLTLLESLTPLERAVFLLREVFDYDYGEIAEITGQAEPACRQMFSRARKHITEQRPRFKPTPQEHRQMLDQFLQAIGTGEVDGLVQMLADDVTLWADGGGKIRGAIRQPLHGREGVARFLVASTRLASEPLRVEITEVNGEPGVVIYMGDRAFLVLAISIDEGQVSEVRVIGNPDKLNWIN